jgi:protein-tyrosine phosphatase
LTKFYPVDAFVAFSPMPRRMLLEALKTFDIIVAAVESHELEYDPSLFPDKVVFVHEPVADYTWPRLSQLLRIARLAALAADEGRRVLIHCRGGLGRSATFAAGYLVYRYGISARRAIGYVRSIRPGAVEHPGQEGVLRSLEQVLAAGIHEPGPGVEEQLRLAGCWPNPSSIATWLEHMVRQG